MQEIQAIQSLQHPAVKLAVKLHARKHRKQENLILVETQHPVEEAFKANLICTTLFIREDKQTDFQGSLKSAKTSYIVDETIMKKISTTETPSEVVGLFEPPVFQKNIITPCLVLCNLQDPGNLGTLVRSALAFGFKQIILLGENTLDPFQPKVVRASTGLLFKLPILHFASTKSFLEAHPGGIEHILLEARAGEPYNKIAFSNSVALWLGNEGNGYQGLDLPENITWANIPVTDQTESLNVATSGSIVMSHLFNR